MYYNLVKEFQKKFSDMDWRKVQGSRKRDSGKLMFLAIKNTRV